MEIDIVSATEISVDGQNVMTGSFLAGHPDQASRVVKLLSRWLTHQLAAKDDACTESINEIRGRLSECEAVFEKAQQDAELAVQEAGRQRDEAISTGRDAVEGARRVIADMARERDEALARAARAEHLQQHHWQLSQSLMQGRDGAAVAAIREIERLNIAGELARLQAKQAALEAAQ